MYATPFTPPRACPHPPCGGTIGPEPEHFVVEEIPAYAPSGSGEHVYLWVEKRDLTTPDLVRRVAAVSHEKERNIGYAGLKDKRAITRQWLSVVSRAEDAATWDLGSEARVVTATRHNNKIRTGHLIGNRFTLTLVGLEGDFFEKAEKIAAWLRESGLPNHFGPQRFGSGGKNLQAALTWLQGLTPRPRDSGEGDGQRRDDRSRGRRKKKPGRFENKMLPSVLQSEIFNRYLDRRMSMGDELLEGEVVRLRGTGSHFVIEDVAQELERFRSGDLLLTGPIHGPKGKREQARAFALEQDVIRDLGLSEEQVSALEREVPGARRDLFVTPEELTLERVAHDSLALAFSLPAGSYATQVAREFTGGDFWAVR